MKHPSGKMLPASPIHSRIPERSYSPVERGRDNAGLQEDSEPKGAAERPYRILIVEDEWMVAVQIETVLNDAGYRIVGSTGDPAEAVDLADETRPDLVLMDIRLRGDGDGIDAAIRIRRQFGIPSLYVTAHSDPRTVARGEIAAPAGWLPKPFTEQGLVAAVKRALDPG